MHWVVNKKKYGETNRNKVVVALDLGLEEYKQVEQPENINKASHGLSCWDDVYVWRSIIVVIMLMCG